MATLAVLASGMVTALGFNAPATLAALRSRVSAVRQTPYVDFESGEPLNGAKVSLPHWWEGVGKLAELAAPAIHECLLAALPESSAEIPILLGVASAERPDRTARIEEDLLAEVHARLDLPCNPYSRLFASDQAGCALALIHAHSLINAHHARRVVVAGVDSFLQQRTLNSYIERRRVMTSGNSNGFFPGEAGTAVLVGPAKSQNAVDELQILGFGQARESATIEGTEPFRARALTQAVQQALSTAGVALKDVAYRLTDISGEHYKFKEAAFTAGRLNSGERDVALDLWHPIEYLGEIGAAILPCLLAQAMHAAQEEYAPGPLALCHVGGDSGARAAMVVGLRRGCTAQL